MGWVKVTPLISYFFCENEIDLKFLDFLGGIKELFRPGFSKT